MKKGQNCILIKLASSSCINSEDLWWWILFNGIQSVDVLRSSQSTLEVEEHRNVTKPVMYSSMATLLGEYISNYALSARGQTTAVF